MRETGRGNDARRWGPIVVVAVLVGIAAVTGCAGPTVQRGACVVVDGGIGREEIRAAECGEQDALRVLEVRTPAQPCHDVPAVTRSHEEFGSGPKLCLGPPDADPATAVNTARPGECLSSGSDPVRVPCGDPGAELQVLGVLAGAEALAADCAGFPGATSELEWRLEGGGLASASTDMVSLCLGPAGTDPDSAIELARPGDCVAEDAGRYRVVGCAVPDARYLVLDRVEGLAESVGACEAIPTATGTIRGSAGLGQDYTLCVAEARR